MFAGVAQGVAYHFDLDVTIVRIAIAVLAVLGPGVLLYVAGWLLIPDEGTDRSVLSDLMESTHFA
jgi:phage shock protein PspC (stress-responsive transcriptional regulator)